MVLGGCVMHVCIDLRIASRRVFFGIYFVKRWILLC